VCSAEEAAQLRPLVGSSMALVTPGIRPAGAESGRPEAHHDACGRDRGGADYLVVGRPVVAAADPKAAAQAIIAEIASAQR